MTAQVQNKTILVAACSAMTVFGLAFGMTHPLLSLLLEEQGVSAKMIGINSAMMPIGILLFSPLIPTLTKRFGSRNVAIVAALVTSLIVFTYYIFNSLEAWFLLRLVHGMSISILFVVSEAWIVGYSGHQHRGKIVAIYGSVLSASFGAGPALISWIGINGAVPFIICGVVIIIGVIPMFFVKEEQLSSGEENRITAVFDFATKAKILLACVMCFAIFDAALLSLLPVYGIQKGLSLSTASLALTALIIGNIFFQLPIGWLADKYEHKIILIYCSVITALMLLILPLSMSSNWMWPILVIAGTSGYGIYTISLAILGNLYSGHELVNGSSAFAIIWGIGALIGSVTGGWAMNEFSADGLPLHLVIIFIMLTLYLVMSTKQFTKQ